MRLLITTDTIGGVWTFSQQLVRSLLERGCAVLLVSLGRAPSPDQSAWTRDMIAEFAEQFRFVAAEFPLEWMPDNRNALAAAPLLHTLAAEFGAQLVHSNQFCFGASFRIAPMLPVVITAHSDVLTWAQACHASLMEESSWLQQYRLLLQTGLRRAAALIAPTHAMLHDLAQSFTLPALNQVIANGCTLSRPRPGADRSLQAVTAGRLWDEGKNIQMLGELSAPPMPLLIAGEIEHGESRLRAHVGHATLLGRLRHEDLLSLFETSAIYICTSQYEPFGLAPLEAALCGCAVLAYDIPTLREVWQDAAGFFSNAYELGLLLQQLAADKDRLARQQRRSQDRAQSYTAERMAEGYLSLFRNILAWDDSGERLHVTSSASVSASANVA